MKKKMKKMLKWIKNACRKNCTFELFFQVIVSYEDNGFQATW